jgi:hypothetical protein
MADAANPCLGILTLYRGEDSPPMPRRPAGALLSPDTFAFSTIQETVEGAWVEVVVRGEPALEPAFVAATKRLVERGATAITSTCGFAIRHQSAVAASVPVPVMLSSLILIPAILRSLPPAAKLAVLTYDSSHCTEDLLPLGSAADRARVVIGGIEGGVFWHNELKRPPPPTDPADIEADVAACIVRLREAHPEIAAILFECAGFPIVASAIRRRFGLPVFDITDLSRMAMSATGTRG